MTDTELKKKIREILEEKIRHGRLCPLGTKQIAMCSCGIKESISELLELVRKEKFKSELFAVMDLDKSLSNRNLSKQVKE